VYETQLALHHANTPAGKSPGVFSITGRGFIQEKVRKLGSRGGGPMNKGKIDNNVG